MIDKQSKRCLSLHEIEIFFQELNISFETNDLILLIIKYDSDLDGKLSYSEFYEMIIPKDTNYSSIINCRTARKEFSSLTLEKIARLFTLLIIKEKEEYSLKSQFNIKEYFNKIDVFLYLSNNNFEYISIPCFKRFINLPSQNEASIVELFKEYDFDQDLKISFVEFVKYFIP